MKTNLGTFLVELNRARILDAEEEARIRHDFKSIREMETEIDNENIGLIIDEDFILELEAE